MKKRLFKTVSLLLCVLLLTSVFAFTATAAETGESEAVGAQSVTSAGFYLFAPRAGTSPSYCATYSDGVEPYTLGDSEYVKNGIAWHDDTADAFIPANEGYKFTAYHSYSVLIVSQASDGYEFGTVNPDYVVLNNRTCKSASVTEDKAGKKILLAMYSFDQIGAETESAFQTQPASREGRPYATTSFWVNCGSSEDYFYVYRNGIYYTQVRIENHDARGFNVELPCFDGEYRIRYYYYRDSYIESDSFTISNGCEFTAQPQNKAGISEASVTFFVNFSSALDYYFVYLDGEYYKSVSIDDRTVQGHTLTLPYSDGQYTIRYYYFPDEYLESEPFTISNGCKFYSQPQNKAGTPLAKTSFYMNCKSSKDYFTILRGGQYYGVQQIDPEAYNYSAELPCSDEEYTIRFYIYGDDYIDSEPFTISNGCKFNSQPATKTGYPDATVNFSVNFVSAKDYYTVLYNGEYYKTVNITDTSGYYYNVTLPAAEGDYSIRCFYYGNEYIDSEPFKINNGCGYLSQPKDAVGSPEARVSFGVNFTSAKDYYEVYLDGKYQKQVNIPDTGVKYFNLYLPCAKGQYTIRFYYNDREYAESDPFTVKEKAALLGDANDDGYVTVSDVTVIQRHAAEIEQIPAYQLKYADINKDGAVDADDAMLVQKYVAKFDVEYFG